MKSDLESYNTNIRLYFLKIKNTALMTYWFYIHKKYTNNKKSDNSRYRNLHILASCFNSLFLLYNVVFGDFFLIMWYWERITVLWLVWNNSIWTIHQHDIKFEPRVVDLVVFSANNKEQWLRWPTSLKNLYAVELCHYFLGISYLHWYKISQTSNLQLSKLCTTTVKVVIFAWEKFMLITQQHNKYINVVNADNYKL
jgi:hypothetical protein